MPPIVQLAWVDGFGPEHQPVRGELGVELVQHDARLDDAGPCAGVDRDEPWQYLDQSITTATLHALPGQAGAAAAGQHRGTVLGAHADGRRGGVDAARHDDADRHLPVVRRVVA